MYQRYSTDKPEEHEFSLSSHCTRFLNEAKFMTGLLMQDATNQLDRIEILNQQKNIQNAIESIWQGVEEGYIRVRSIAVLRAVRKVSCPDIENRLKSPNIDHARIIKDLRLLINTFEYIIKPEPA
ncbi:hypothetical protein EU527_01220 [Candidatus Thorarchaeota archaeon]|nr:MAG: hypothetical protein EU527_01220 [Candidatus Thorarchaeota archaeon]